MVCLGNICRSPLAEGILKEKIKKAGLSWKGDSAGTNHYHTGEAPHQFSQKAAAQNGININEQRARRFIKKDIDQFDKIYALAPDVLDEMKLIAGEKFDKQKVDLLLNELYPGENREVIDPWYEPEAGYHDVFDIINRACDSIINNYSKK